MRKLIAAALLALSAITAQASTTVLVNGTSYTIPTTNEKGWGTNVTNWISAISGASLYPGSGTFTLTSDLNFGGSYGLKSIYFTSRSANPASAGVFRLANTDSISWRNAANGANLGLSVNASDQLTFNGNPLFTGTALTANRAVVTGASGLLGVSSATDTQIGYLNTLSSNAQTQLDGKQPLDSTLTSLAAYNTNGLIAQTAADTFAGRTLTGTANQVIVTNGNGVSGNPTLSLPQDIGTSSTPTFGTVTATTFTGAHVGNVTGNVSGSAASITGNLTGDVTSTAMATTIANDAVTNAKAANMATQTIKGRTTAGTGDPEDLTATQATAILNAVVGDSGSGGTKGLVPAPGAGDAAASKYLKADGTWASPSGAGDVTTGFTTTVDGEAALFSGTGGKTLKRATGTGVVHRTSGVDSVSTVTNAELAGSIAASKLVGSDIATVGTVTTGTWQGTAVGAAYGGFGLSIASSSGVPLFASGVPTFTSTTGTGNFARAIAPTFTGTSLFDSLTLQATAPVLQITPATATNGTSIRMLNTGNPSSAYFGIEDSVGGSIFSGTSAYSVYVGTGAARSLHLITNGAVRQTVDSSGVATFLGQLVGKGTTTNDSAAAGYIGEYISANSAGVSNATITSAGDGGTVNVASVSLTAGDWDCAGALEPSISGSATVTGVSGGVSTQSLTEQSGSGGYMKFNSTAGIVVTTQWYPTGTRRISLSGSSTIYLVGVLRFSPLGTTTWGTGSFIGCRRTR